MDLLADSLRCGVGRKVLDTISDESDKVYLWKGPSHITARFRGLLYRLILATVPVYV